MSLVKLAVAAMPNNQFINHDNSSDDEYNDQGNVAAKKTYNKSSKATTFKALKIIKETPKNSVENI